MLAHPVVVEHLREVRPSAVREDHEHRLVRRQLGGERQRGLHRHAAGAADQDALGARDRARAEERVAVGDLDPAVDDRGVERLGPEVLADALDQVRVDIARVDRALGIGADDLDRRVLLLQVAPDARDRAAGADADDEVIEVVADLAPDLGAGRARSASPGSPGSRTGSGCTRSGSPRPAGGTRSSSCAGPRARRRSGRRRPRRRARAAAGSSRATACRPSRRCSGTRAPRRPSRARRRCCPRSARRSCRPAATALPARPPRSSAARSGP